MRHSFNQAKCLLEKEFGLIIPVKVTSINLGHTIDYMQYTFIIQRQNYPITPNRTLSASVTSKQSAVPFFPTKKSPNISYMIYWDFLFLTIEALLWIIRVPEVATNLVEGLVNPLGQAAYLVEAGIIVIPGVGVDGNGIAAVMGHEGGHVILLWGT